MLSQEQQIQEDEYKIPYHWVKDRSTYSGRLYFGYLSLCLSMINKNKIKDLKMLDGGCGDGRFLGYLLEHGARKENLAGVDYSAKAINFAKIILPGVKFSAADLTEDLPFPDNYFDAVFLIEILEHIMPEKINQLFCNIKKVLKNNGTLIISVPANVASHGSKDYQYFSAQSLTEYLEPHFGKIEIVGQDKMGVHFLELVYKLLDNRFWLIRPLAEYYNLHIWSKYFNRGELSKSRRLIARAVKINA